MFNFKLRELLKLPLSPVAPQIWHVNDRKLGKSLKIIKILFRYFDRWRSLQWTHDSATCILKGVAHVHEFRFLVILTEHTVRRLKGSYSYAMNLTNNNLQTSYCFVFLNAREFDATTGDTRGVICKRFAGNVI